jgi:flavodoxin
MTINSEFHEPDSTKHIFPKGDKVLIAYATETGTAQALAKRVFTENQSRCDFINIADIKPELLEAYGQQVFVVSTFGDGQAPVNARPFFRALQRSSIQLKGVLCAVLALGNKHYPNFCEFGKNLAEQLTQLGADQRLPITKINRADPAEFSHWWLKLGETFTLNVEQELDEWMVATVMDVEKHDEASVDLIFYIQSLEHAHTNALLFQPKTKRKNITPLSLATKAEMHSPFTFVNLTYEMVERDQSGIVKQLFSATSGDKWHVRVPGLDSDAKMEATR